LKLPGMIVTIIFGFDWIVLNSINLNHWDHRFWVKTKSCFYLFREYAKAMAQ
jgi:hypothetical protein